MRVAYVCADPGIPVFGAKGASVHVQEIVRAFLSRGDDVVLYCTRRGDRVPADLGGIAVVEETVPRADARGREIQVAHAADALARRVIADGCDLVYERFSLFSRACADVAAALGVPTVLEVNAPLIDEQRAHRVLVDEAGAERRARAALRAATAVVCVSEPVATWARACGAERVDVVPNGVNTDRVRPAARTDGRPFTVGFVGTLKPWHGVETLVTAMSLLSANDTARLLVIGDGPAGAALRDQTRRLGVDAEFTGPVDPADVPAQLAACDVGVAPYPASDDSYFSPLKVYEYLAAGLPVVASRVGQIPQIVTDGVTGLLTEPGDAASLAAALDLLHRDPALRAAMGRAGRAQAVARHDWRAVLGGILDVLPAGDGRTTPLPPATAEEATT